MIHFKTILSVCECIHLIQRQIMKSRNHVSLGCITKRKSFFKDVQHMFYFSSGVWITVGKQTEIIIKPLLAWTHVVIVLKICFTHSHIVKSASNVTHGLTINVINVS